MRIAAVVTLALAASLLGACHAPGPTSRAPSRDRPYVILLGTAQDGGSPQVNSPASHPARLDPDERRHVVCLGIVDPRDGRRWMIEATPDFRDQAWTLMNAAPARTGIAPLDGVLLTHAHIGHYAGLMFLGHESMGARRVPVHAMPRMSEFLSTNGPWDQLVRYENIVIHTMAAETPVTLAADLTVTPIRVPHREEYSEVVCFRIDGPQRSLLFIPDIDSWDEWEAMGHPLEDEIGRVDVALLDGTFFANDEIPGRDMSGFPHPRIRDSVERLRGMPPADRGDVRFIHLNHTNPAQWAGSPERRFVEDAGFRIAVQGEVIDL